MMGDKTLEKHLARSFESSLRQFLSLPILERLEKAKDLFRWQNEQLYSIFEKLSDFVKRDIEHKTDEEKEVYFAETLDENLRVYLDREYQHILYYLPYILWASHTIFDGTHSPLTYDAREELRHDCNLDTPKKRKDAYTNFFARFIDEKVVDGGSQSHWNEWTRLYFLSLYERFSIVIKNARNDIKILTRRKTPAMEIKKEVLAKYRIPEDCWSDVLKNTRRDIIARKWASNRMQKEFKKYIHKRGFADSYLVKVLVQAREETKKHIPCNCRNYDNHKLIFLKWGDIRLFQNTYRLKKEALLELKFDSFFSEKTPGMELYFV